MGTRDVEPATQDSAASSPRIVVLELNTESGSATSARSMCINVGSDLVVGREGDMVLGVEPEDLGVSREALRVLAHEGGWEIAVTNLNGAWLHPWGQGPTRLESGKVVELRWPRIGIRVVGRNREYEHWTLVEFDGYSVDVPSQAPANDPRQTNSPPMPDALTDRQREALTSVFREYLAWPPRSGPRAHALQAVAKRLGVTDTAITDRLEGAKQRAYQLGHHQHIGVTDPSYVYVLVSYGYLDPPQAVAGADPLE